MATQLWKSFNGHIFETKQECTDYEERIKTSKEFNEKIEQMLSYDEMKNIFKENVGSLLFSSLNKILGVLEFDNLYKICNKGELSKMTFGYSWGSHHPLFLIGNVGISVYPIPLNGGGCNKGITMYYFLDGSQERLSTIRTNDRIDFKFVGVDNNNRVSMRSDGLSEKFFYNQLVGFRDIEKNINSFQSQLEKEINEKLDMRAYIKNIIIENNLSI